MKKNISINLFGTLYAIDEDAYNLLERYLDSMKSYFSRQEGGEEIADDIEHRVAELLWQEKEKGSEAVNIEMIKEIIGKIGDPAQIDGNENSDNESTDSNNGEPLDSHPFADGGSGNSTNEHNRSAFSGTANENIFENIKKGIHERRLYRDISNKMLGGVCSGLSRYFGGDVTIWRLGTVILAFILWWSTDMWWVPGLLGWIIPLAYITLCFVVPVARTPEDQLRMRGEEVSPQNINEEIIRESNDNQQRIYSQKSPSNGSGCLKALLIVGAIIILFPLFAGLVGLLFASSIFSGFVSSGFINHLFADPSEASFFSSLLGNMQWMFWCVLLCTIALCSIPIIFIIRAIRGKHTSGTSLLVWGAIWLVILISCIFFVSKSIGQIGNEAINQKKIEWSWHMGPYSYNKTVTVSDAPDSICADTTCYMEPLEPELDTVVPPKPASPSIKK